VPAGRALGRKDGGRCRARARAFLVAVPDPHGPAFPTREAPTFRAASPHRLPFATLVIASSDDPYASLDYARATAAAWGAGFVLAGALGHINGAIAWATGRRGWPCSTPSVPGQALQRCLADEC
jgi:predicted alpha/beta hydrolase family esterase